MAFLLLGTGLFALSALAVPTGVQEASFPLITAAPDLRNRVVPERRDLDPLSWASSKIHGFGSDISSYVLSGVPQYFQDFPTGDDVLSSLGLDDSDLDAKPTQALNIPGYGNWTNDGWNVRVHGNIYKIPDISQEKLDDLANVFLVGKDIDELSPDEQAQARNVTQSIFVVQQGDVNVTVNFQQNVEAPPNENGGVVNAEGGSQWLQLPYETTSEGDFDTFITLKNTTGSDGGHLLAGNETDSIQALNVYTNGTESGNATAYLVPPRGYTVVSDIDDILRVTKIYVPKEGLMNSFARAFRPWMNMPEIYANWSTSIPNFHYHYLTTTPEQVTRNYMDFIYNTYPLGSFDTRPLNFSDVSATLSIRQFLLTKVFETFPDRRFILVGDTTNSDVMKDYPGLLRDYPDQVQCIFLRNTTSTDDTDLFPYDTSHFEGLDEKRYMFFNVPDDLRGIDVSGGADADCRNASVQQTVTFGYQGRGFGNDEGAAGGFSSQRNQGLLISMVLVVVASLTLW